MSKKLLLLVVLVFWVHYSYSESITPYYGQTGNAAVDGLRWNMDNVFPSGVPGLEVNSIIYNYVIHKQTQDQVNVYVQNENALGSGYIFREVDEWLPGSLDGTQINKALPILPNIPRAAWGDGSIEVEGNGSVSEPNVIYSYRVDPCFNPQFDPNCPGYEVPQPTVYEVDIASLYDATKDENIDLENEVDKELIEKEDEEEKSDKEKEDEEKSEKEDREMRLEKALAAADNSAMFATAVAQAQMLASMNAAVQMNSYYNATIAGGSYKESVVLVDKQLPENKRGLRNGFAQQLLHEKMIEMQY